MKYKLFETFIKYNDKNVIPLLKDLALSFKGVIGKIKNDNDVNFIIKQHFLDDGKIFTHLFYGKQKLFTCKFILENDYVTILYTKYINWYKVDTSAVDNVFIKIQKYTNEIKPFGSSEMYIISFDNVNKLIDIFNMYINSEKYNL